MNRLDSLKRHCRLAVSKRRLSACCQRSERQLTFANRRPETGSALLLVLFAILLISSLITTMVVFVKQGIDDYGVYNREFQARQLAQSGLAIALNPVVQNTDRALLQQTRPGGGKFHASIASESALLNINYLLQTQRTDILQRLFDHWGVETTDSKTAITGLIKWVSSGAPDGNQSGDPTQTQMQMLAQSMQKGANGGMQPLQIVRPFQAVQEMSLVPEFAPVMKMKPDWAQHFTVWGDGKIDVNEASADIISLVTGVNPDVARQFVKYRWGRDGIPDTEDDQFYMSSQQVQAALGMSQAQFQLVGDLLSLNSAVDRVESKGIMGGCTVTIVAIANRNSVPIQYFVWQER
jgi:general secretion pathway protein K